MSTQPVTTETPEVPAAPVVETPNPRKFSRSIQAKDAEGNPVGAPQVFYGATEQELIDRMAEAQAHATVKIRELSRKTTLETPTFTAPEGADPFEDIPDPKPRELSPDELASISAKLSKPETVREGYRELFRAETGMDPEQAARVQTQQARDAAQMKALEAARLFMAAHPEFVPCPQNRSALNDFFMTRKIGPTLKNFELAFKELSASGLLVLRTEEPEVEAPPAVTPEPRIETPAEPAQPVIPASLTRRNASGGDAPAKKKGPTAKELAMMTADELRKHYESIGQWPTSAKAIR